MAEKWNPDKHEPEQLCQTVKGDGVRCTNLVCTNSRHCPMHGGNAGAQAYEKKSLNMYRLARYQQRMTEFAEHDKVKSLQSEIGILRMLLEEKMNACQTQMELTLAAGPISDLVLKIDRLVNSCHKIDNQLGNLLDKHRVQTLASTLLNIVNDVVSNCELTEVQKGEVLSSIAEGFLQTLKEM